MRKILASVGTFATIGALLLSGCTPNNNASSSEGESKDGEISVTSTDTACNLSTTEAKAGKVTFKVKNEGSKVTEFYVLGSDGLRIISEVENIGPNLERSLTVELPEGSYKTACKPGMVGDGIQGDFKVTKNENAQPVAEDVKQARETAVTQYTSYVKDQVESLKTKTDEFVQLYKDGKTEEAKAKYASARLHYERIEPVAEQFDKGELDKKLDAREADLSEGKITEWTGWHKLEKDLWPPKAQDNDGKEYTALSPEDRKKEADQLAKDTQTLYDYVHSDKFEITINDISNGSKELLDEIVDTKLSGEEEVWSHTDLSDFQGNIDGAKVAYENVRPILDKNDPELSKKLETNFATVQGLLNKHKTGQEFKTFDKLSESEKRELADAIRALAEPVADMTAAVVGEGGSGNNKSEDKKDDKAKSEPASSNASASGGASSPASSSASTGAYSSASAGASGAPSGSASSAGSSASPSQ